MVRPPHSIRYRLEIVGHDSVVSPRHLEQLRDLEPGPITAEGWRGCAPYMVDAALELVRFRGYGGKPTRTEVRIVQVEAALDLSQFPAC